jgi:short-subunit dehydrogenase
VLALCPGSTDTEAHALQGVDQSKLGEMMLAAEVARLALDNISEGPVYIAGEENQQMFTALTQMPRRDTLLILGETMKQSLLADG